MDFAMLAISSVFKNLDRTPGNFDLNAAELDSSSRFLKSESGDPTLVRLWSLCAILAYTPCHQGG
jgi:hypothetical protein